MMLFSGKKNRSRTDRRARDLDREAILTDASPWPVREAYRALRTNIIFSLPGKEGKVIAVTSSGRREGKSTNCLNTAISFGQLDKKVIVLDCDMRLPTIAAKRPPFAERAGRCDSGRQYSAGPDASSAVEAAGHTDYGSSKGLRLYFH